MKKIVALVLCLALALSLCTVAFGATTGKQYSEVLNEADKYVIKDKENKTVLEKMDIIKYTHEPDVDDDGKKTYYATTYVGKEDTSGRGYAEVAEEYADYKLLKDGKFVCGLRECSPTPYSAYTTIEIVKFIDKADEKACGVYVDTNDKPIKVAVRSTGDVFDANGEANWAVYNGKFITVGGEKLKPVAHTFNANSKFTRVENLNTKDIATVQCTECKVYFKADDELPLKYDGKADTHYVKVDANVANIGGLYIFVAEPTTTSTGSSSGTTVESAKTFDAGIALYAGMALASVAGSAVVIGKKKEF